MASVSWSQSDFWCAPSFPESTLLTAQTAFVSRWSFYIVLLLVYTAIVTPVEVAFLTTSLDALFVFNRVVDLSFLVVRAHWPGVAAVKVRPQNVTYAHISDGHCGANCRCGG